MIEIIPPVRSVVGQGLRLLVYDVLKPARAWENTVERALDTGGGIIVS